jgi:hypothetical protein
VTEVLKGRDGISQIDGDTLPDVRFHTAPHEKQARGGEPGGND